jgi:dTDP-4-amino-4,6-dideoxygalactose transaminase
MTDLARLRNVIVIEDEAHALFTDLVNGHSGRSGDAAFFSLHKMLPVQYGGALILNNTAVLMNKEALTGGRVQDIEIVPWNFDLKRISDIRRRNATFLYKMLENVNGLKMLKPLPDLVCPQTVPVIIDQDKRDYLYFTMNKLGFGVVSLYHMLIDQISKKDFSITHELSHKILNLPVHQDISEEQLCVFVSELIRLLKN